VIIRTLLASILAGLVFSAPLLAQSGIHPSTFHDFRVVTVADGFEIPWSIAFLPDGDMLVTERPGRLRIVRDGELLPDPVPGVPEVVAQGQGGLFDVVPHPEFASNRLLYLSFAKPVEGVEESTTTLVRARFLDDRLVELEELFEADTRGRGHYGGRIAFGPDGHLFLTVGERQASTNADLETHPAQDRSNHHGVVIRLRDDGTVPEDNPFVGQPNIRPEIWSYGHRNPQGLAFHPGTGDLWATEHGPQGGDEVNLIEPGLNYGWPVIGYGVNYRSGSAIHGGTQQEGMEEPVHVWVPSIAASGLMIYDGNRFPEWRGSMFAGGLGGEQLARLTLDGQEITVEETLLYGLGRIRDVREGPDGYIYIAIEDRNGGTTSVVRLEPVEES
jgi:glucose/arabinose dehydrogenase